MNGSTLALAVMVLVTAFALTLLTDEAGERKEADAVATAQAIYATAGMLRAEVSAGYTIPGTLTPISAAPLPTWYSAPPGSSFFLLKHSGHDYLVARFASDGAAARVYRQAERLSPGATFKVSGGQLRRTSVSASSAPAPAGVASYDLVVKVDAKG